MGFEAPLKTNYMPMEIARHWRLKKQRYLLEGEICENGHKVFPPRDICPDCHGEAKIPFAMSGNGVIYSFTENLAIIELQEGPRVTAGLTDFDHKPEIGEPVEMTVRKLGVDGDENRGQIIYGYKFRPAFSSK